MAAEKRRSMMVEPANMPEPTPEEREAMRRFEEEMAKLRVYDHVFFMMQSLSQLAVEKMGLTPDSAERRDLEEARMAIDAFRALLGVLEGRRPAEEMVAHRGVLSQLQTGYVTALNRVPAQDGGGEDA
jgi:hypothetical protein